MGKVEHSNQSQPVLKLLMKLLEGIKSTEPHQKKLSACDGHCLLSPVSDAAPGDVELWPRHQFQLAVIRAPHRVRRQSRLGVRAAARHRAVRLPAGLAVVVEEISGDAEDPQSITDL